VLASASWECINPIPRSISPGFSRGGPGAEFIFERFSRAAKHLHVIVPPLSRMPSSRASDRHRMVPSCPNDRATSREEYPDRDHQSAGARIGLDPDIDWNTVFCRIPDRKPI